MAYARRAPGMILFEIQQGFVARGASISWLSQHPEEAEILFPPLTTLEVTGTKIDGAVVVVQLRPAMKAPGLIKTGTDDLDAMEKERAEFRSQLARYVHMPTRLRFAQAHSQTCTHDTRFARVCDRRPLTCMHALTHAHTQVRGRVAGAACTRAADAGQGGREGVVAKVGVRDAGADDQVEAL